MIMTFNKYQQLQDMGVITTIPEYITSPTLKGYEYALTPIREGNAHLMTDNYDLDFVLLRIIFSLYKNIVDVHGWDAIRKTINIYAPVFVSALGLGTRSGITDVIVSKLSAFIGINGVLDNDVLPVITAVTYEPVERIISIHSPYLVYLLRTLLNAVTSDDSNKSKPKYKYWFESLVSTSIYKERCAAAVENVFILTRAIATSSRSTINISASTLINRNPVFKVQLLNDKNRRQHINRITTCTEKYLGNDTRLREVYQKFEVSGLNFKLTDFQNREIQITYRKKHK